MDYGKPRVRANLKISTYYDSHFSPVTTSRPENNKRVSELRQMYDLAGANGGVVSRKIGSTSRFPNTMLV